LVCDKLEGINVICTGIKNYRDGYKKNKRRYS
jgi:hypothetical protein